jgi:23S rRNA (uracil1939-C5)-methyltransferase
MSLIPGESISVAIEKPAAGGRMIARIDGQVVLVGGAIPGEKVTARIVRVAKNVAYADTLSVDDPSADRRSSHGDPLCGGCLYAHIAYPRQLALKSLVIADAFARIAHLELPSAVRVAASPEAGYRMRARLHVRGGHLGFFREGTHEICDARATQQLLSATCDVLDRLALGLESLGMGRIGEVELSENVDASERVVYVDPGPGSDAQTLHGLTCGEGLTPGPYVTDALTIDGRSPMRLRRHVLSFFQGNRYLVGDLVAHVVGHAPAGTVLTDLYAGVGLFAVAAAIVKEARVTAVEGDRLAAADLTANAAALGASVTAVHQPVETFLARLPRQPGAAPHAETIILDPPRTGLSREALDGVTASRARRLVYVSCDVATLARDARRLVDAGYAITHIEAFDLFPNTPHVETVVVFDS